MTHLFSLPLLLSAGFVKSCFCFPVIQVGLITSDSHENRKNRDATKIETRDTSEEDATKRVAQRHLAGTRCNRSMVLLRQPDDLYLFLK